jgi:hypothetical protein
MKNKKQDDFGRFYEDALAYLRMAVRRGEEPAEILGTLLHDIGGIMRHERCFCPRVDGYAKIEAEIEKNSSRSPLKTPSKG